MYYGQLFEILGLHRYVHSLNFCYVICIMQPRPQALFGQRRYGGKTGSARDDGPEALRGAVCIDPTTPCEPRTINPITQSASRQTKERRLGTRQCIMYIPVRKYRTTVPSMKLYFS